MNNVSTEAIDIGRNIHTGMGMFIRFFLSLYCLSFFNLVFSNFSKMILVRFMFMLYVVKSVFACFCD
jgi:hypothetical protein